jgi:hypothetical protein
MRYLLILLIFVSACQSNSSKDIKTDTSQKIISKPKKTVKKPLAEDSLAWKTLPSLQFKNNSIIYKYYDINRDGYKDSLVIEFWQSENPEYYKIYNGKTKELLKISSENISSGVIQVPYHYKSPENQDFIEAIFNSTYLPYPKSTKTDPTFQWVLESSLSKRFLPTNPFFEYVFNFKTRFIQGEFQFPNSYRLEVQNDSLKRLCEQKLRKINQSFQANRLTHYIHYAPNFGHKSLNLLDSSSIYKVFELYQKSVIIQKDKTFAWLFIPEKYLLKESNNMYDFGRGDDFLESVKLIDKYILFLHNLGTPYRTIQNKREAFIINIEQGICARFKPSENIGYIKYYTFKDNWLEITYIENESLKEKSIKLYFPAICQALNKL